MNNRSDERIMVRLREMRKRRWQIGLLSCLCLLVAVGVAGFFHLPATAKTYQKWVLTCPAEAPAGPGYAGFFLHTHNDDCLDENGNLVCPLPEIKAHVHDENCFVVSRELDCAIPESDGHKHTAECYTRVRGDLTCTLPTEPVLDEEGNVLEEGHVHTDECYAWHEELSCGMEEGEGAHHHDENCYRTITTLTCDKAELIPHVHTDACYTEDEAGNVYLICGMQELTEHVHGPECFTVYELDDGVAEEESAEAVAPEEEPAPEDEPAEEAGAGEDQPADDTDPVTEEETGVTEGETAERIEETTEPSEPEDDGFIFLYPEEEENITETETGTEEPAPEDETGETGEAEDGTEDDAEGDENASRPDEPAPEEEQPKESLEISMPAQTFSGETENVVVSVTAPEGAFPEGTTMEVKMVEVDDETMSSVEKAVEGKVTTVQAVDITFYDAEGNKIEPQTAIQVSMKSAVVSESENVSLIHKPDAAETDDPEAEAPALEVMEAAIVEQEDAAAPSDEITFESNAFSVYMLVGTTIEKKVLASDGHNYKISLSYGPEAGIPADAELAVEEIMPDSEAYQAYLGMAEASVENEMVSFARFFDITILSGGVEIQPAAAVDVKIELADELDESAKAIHFGDEVELIDAAVSGAPETAGNEDAAEQTQSTEATENAGSEMAFSAESFSVYGVIMTTLEKTITASDGNTYSVSVTYGADAKIPANAALDVREILPAETGEESASTEYDEYIRETESILGLEAGSIPYARFFDITILGAEAEKLQPAEGTTVAVSVQLLDVESIDEAVQIVHFRDDAQTADVISALSVEGQTVQFAADGFSAYAIVKGPSAVPLDWTKIETVKALSADAATGLYIGTTGGFYLTGETAVGSTDAKTTGIVKTTPAQNVPAEAAVKYYFEAVENTENQFYIYCLDGETKKYVKNTGDANLYLNDESGKTAFTVLADNKGVRFQNGNRYWNMWSGANGNHIAAYDKPTDGNNYFYIWKHDDAYAGDPYGLDGETYGLMYWTDGTMGKAVMAKDQGAEGRLEALSLTVMSKPKDGAKLYVPDNSDISFWTFHHVEEDLYYLTAVVDGSTKYLQITSSGLAMVSTPDAGCRIQVIPGTGTHSGQISLKANNRTLTYSGAIESGFRTGGSAGTEWLNLVEESELDSSYFMTYSANKVSVSDEKVTNGSRVIVYTRVWNDTTKKYEFYAVDHDGSLVRCYESGDDIQWVGGRLNSMLWNFTEYYWEGTTDPNGYYELYNQYSEKYISPQKSSEQILSDTPIGINMNGRQNGRYYSPVVAWDDGYYAYAGMKAENGRVVSCPLDEADDFYFAIVDDLPVDDELTTVETVDHVRHGITMKMVNFGTDLYVGTNNDAVRKNMSDFLGSDNEYKHGNVEKGLLHTQLGADGYPTSKAGNSLAAWFANAQEVNHLFIASTYSGTGYFEYNSVENFAHLNPASNEFVVYKELAASASNGQFHDHGHFWPYNDIKAGVFASNKNTRDALGNVLPESDPRKYERLYVPQKSNTAYAPDYYMGMEVTASFTQTPNGLDDWGHDIIYEFTGDDDFWLFVDGELIIDLGGVHDALAGSVNYRTGDVYVNGAHHTLRELFESNYRERNPGASHEQVNDYLNGIFDGEIFKDYSTHTMKIYYLERGAGASNLHMRFNLASIKPGTAQLTKHLSGVETTETVLAEFPYQILYRLKDSSGVITEHYLTNARPNDPSRIRDHVFYKDSTVPVTYQTEYSVGGKVYQNVFILKPEETADINFPLEDLAEGMELVDYRVIECGVNTEVYTGVTVNGTELTGSEVRDAQGELIKGRKDYATEYATTEARGRVVYDNTVSPDALKNMTITKKLYDVTGETVIPEEEDGTVFDFRLYLATESGEIDSSPANMHTYHVKDPKGNYCTWDVTKQRIVSLGVGKDTYAELTPEEQEAATFHTSMNGSITKIPVGYTVEVRDLLAGTKFKLVERPWEIPDGYSFLKYVYKRTEYSDAAGGVSDTIRTADTDPYVEVHNVKGFGLRVNKVWTDADFMTARDATYFGIFYSDSGNEPQPVPDSFRKLSYGENSVYWYYDRLPVEGITDFLNYVIYEVTLKGAVTDENGKVTEYESYERLEGPDAVSLNGTQVGDQSPAVFTYTVSYDRGKPSTNNNVRVDHVTNSRPGIILKKSRWDGETPLAGAVFTLADEAGNQIGTYTSGEDGLITEAFLRNGISYTLTETSAPQGWHGPESAMHITMNGQELSISGIDGSYYQVTQGSDTEKTTITVKNRPYAFRAIKLDADTDEPIANVGFRLYRQITVDNVQSWDPNPYPGYGNLKSGKDGVIFELSENMLPAGTYQLRESDPLPGYQALSGHVTFTVSKTGTVALPDTAPEEASIESSQQQDGSVLYTLSITNAKVMKVSVWKTDGGYTTLTGAEFSLYRAEDYDDAAGKPKSGAQAIQSGTVGSNGILALGSLTAGEYRLVETKAPDGYIPVDAAVQITVDGGDIRAYQNETPLLVSTKDSEDGHWVPGQDQDTRQIRVPNYSGYELPQTGGAGTALFTVLGGIMTATAGAILTLRKRKGHA